VDPKKRTSEHIQTTQLVLTWLQTSQTSASSSSKTTLYPSRDR
jgi:hypothetical protein